MHKKSPETKFIDNLLRDLPVESTAQALITIQRLKELGEELVGGPTGILSAFFKGPEKGGEGDLLFHLARLQMQQLRMIADFASEQVERATRQARRGADLARANVVVPTRIIQCSGAIGTTAHCHPPLRIVNRGPAPTTPQIDTDAVVFVDEEGNAIQDSKKVMTVAGLTKLQPGAVAPVRISIALGRANGFQPGLWYFTEFYVQVRGSRVEHIKLEVQVEAESRRKQGSGAKKS